MILDIFNRINFLDIVIIIVLFRACYIAVKTGLVIEIFKFLGVIFATYISLHYYISLSDIVQKRLLPEGMPVEFFDFLIFLILLIAGYMLFVAIRVTFYRFIKLEALPVINKFGGLILGTIRGFFIVGLLVFTLSISTTNYLTNSVKHSYFGKRLSLISPNTYSWFWNNIFSKFSPKEKFNSAVNQATDRLNTDEIN